MRKHLSWICAVTIGVAVLLVVLVPKIGAGTTSMSDLRKEMTAGRQMVQLYTERHGPMTPEQAFEFVDNAHQACAYLSKNPNVPQLWLDMTDGRLSGDAAATTIEAGIRYLCPEFESLLA